MAETIRVVVVDDHDMVRKGLGVLLESFPDLEPVGQAGDGEHAIRLCDETDPDVVLLDLVMPDMSGPEVISSILKKNPHIKIIALTNYKDEQLVHGALNAGAISYLLKNVSIDELAAAIRSAYEGKSILAPEAAQALVKAATRPPKPGHDLTNREHEILRLIVSGMNNREIADHLIISQSTVKNHVTSIFMKLGVSSRAEAVALAVHHQLIDWPKA
jgi:NarL family two-component system response regulator LiaR